MADGFVSVSRHIHASPEALFALLTDSGNHPLIDGSGMVRVPDPAVMVLGVGDSFSMKMHHDRFGDYEMRNEVVEYEEDRRLTWEPRRVAATPEEQAELGDPPHYRWGWQLSPADRGATLVTETFDCTRSPDYLREAVKEGEGWLDAMTESLIKLELLARSVGERD
jgi:uncharacterized protein YndB with AHSA1/START domain